MLPLNFVYCNRLLDTHPDASLLPIGFDIESLKDQIVGLVNYFIVIMYEISCFYLKTLQVYLFCLQSIPDDAVLKAAVNFLTGNAEIVQKIVKDCASDEQYLINVSKSVCKLISSLSKMPAVVSSHSKGMIRLDRQSGTSGQFIARITKIAKGEQDW